MRHDLVKKATGKAAAYCARRERTAMDVRAYTEKYGLSADEINEVIEYLQKNGFLDEERYARAFAADRFRFNGWGRNKIRHALRSKQIPEACIEAGTEALSDEEYLQTALDLLRHKYRSLGRRSEAEKKAKAARFLIGKGFEHTLVYDLLNTLESNG